MNREYLQDFIQAFEGPPEVESAFVDREEMRMLRSEPELLQPIIVVPVDGLQTGLIKVHNSSRIDGFCKLEGGKGLTIGRYVHIASYSHIGLGGGTTIIEDYVGISSGCVVISGSNVVDNFPSMSAVAPFHLRGIDRTKTTTLRRFSGLYAHAIVGPGVTLHEGAILGAHSFTMHDIPAWQIWAGSPAKFVRMRERKDPQ